MSARKKNKQYRNPATGQLVKPKKAGPDWIDKVLEGADNRMHTFFDDHPKVCAELAQLLIRAAEKRIEVSRPFLCRIIQERHGVKLSSATITRYLNDEAPEEVQAAWAKVRRSHGRRMG